MRLLPILLSLLIANSLHAVNLTEEQRLSEHLDGSGLRGSTHWLTADDIRFLTILEQSTADKRLGGVILLHDAGDHANGADMIAPLCHALALRGWDTLSVQLPRPSDPASAAEQAAAVSQAVPRLAAAVQFLKTRESVPISLVGHGLGARMALAYLEQGRDDALQALVAIGLALDEAEGGDVDPVSRAISALQLPMLDLYGDRDHPEVTATAPIRRGAAKRNGREAYRQDRVMGADHRFNGLQEHLQRRVSSWLLRVTEEAASTKP